MNSTSDSGTSLDIVHLLRVVDSRIQPGEVLLLIYKIYKEATAVLLEKLTGACNKSSVCFDIMYIMQLNVS